MTKLQKFINFIAWLLVAVFVVFTLLLVGARFAGLSAYTVLSGSMEPEIMTGSLIYVRPVDTSSIVTGDIITFMLDENTVATHRVIDVLADDGTLRFVTQGDTNPTPDANPVHYKNVIGTPVFEIPLLGYAASFISNPPGVYVTAIILAAIIIVIFLPDAIAAAVVARQNKLALREIDEAEKIDFADDSDGANDEDK
ncbi:MAG: signal peptidase I [Ruminococcaceae bacterium]|nr:signal peptidase I [Oscillospiraceae bacterium]